MATQQQVKEDSSTTLSSEIDALGTSVAAINLKDSRTPAAAATSVPPSTAKASTTVKTTATAAASASAAKASATKSSSSASSTTPATLPPRSKGVCKFFSSQKGYGFIIPEHGDLEVFVHHTSIIKPDGGFRSLAEGEIVEFDLFQGAKGLHAANVSGPGGSAVIGDPKARNGARSSPNPRSSFQQQPSQPQHQPQPQHYWSSTEKDAGYVYNSTAMNPPTHFNGFYYALGSDSVANSNAAPASRPALSSTPHPQYQIRTPQSHPTSFLGYSSPPMSAAPPFYQFYGVPESSSH